MARTLLVRGMLVGLAAGLVALIVAKVFGEPQVSAAIAYESARAAAAGEIPEPEMVSRTVQSTIGLATGVLVFGVALGGIYALVFAAVQGRIAALGARSTAALVAMAGFVVVALVPFLKYPATPPGANLAETIGRRTTLYFMMIAASIITALVALWIGRAISTRRRPLNATLRAVGVYVVLVAVVVQVMPVVNEIPADFPTTVLVKFRIASLAGQVATWATLGWWFGELTERARRKVQERLPVNA